MGGKSVDNWGGVDAVGGSWLTVAAVGGGMRTRRGFNTIPLLLSPGVKKQKDETGRTRKRERVCVCVRDREQEKHNGGSLFVVVFKDIVLYTAVLAAWAAALALASLTIST